MRRFTVQRPAFQHRRRAFTLVELLVVIAIIGVLVGLLLPAVQAAREAARKLQCQNTVHNLALAVMNYESQQGALPQSTTDISLDGKSVPGVYRSQSLSWIVRILPFVEQQQLYDQFDMEKTLFQQNRTQAPYSAQPSFLLCPSGEAQGRIYQSRQAGGIPMSKGNYAAYGSPEHAECMPIARGALIHVPLPLKRVQDGTSNTIMLSEVRTRDEMRDQRGAWAIARVGSSILAADMHATTSSMRICNQSSPPDYVPNAIWSRFVLLPNAGVGATAYEDKLTECPPSAQGDLDDMPCSVSNETIAAARSQHVGGVNSARIDGSVQWLSNDIEPVVLGSMICIDDGLTVSP